MAWLGEVTFKIPICGIYYTSDEQVYKCCHGFGFEIWMISMPTIEIKFGKICILTIL